MLVQVYFSLIIIIYSPFYYFLSRRFGITIFWPLTRCARLHSVWGGLLEAKETMGMSCPMSYHIVISCWNALSSSYHHCLSNCVEICQSFCCTKFICAEIHYLMCLQRRHEVYLLASSTIPSLPFSDILPSCNLIHTSFHTHIPIRKRSFCLTYTPVFSIIFRAVILADSRYNRQDKRSKFPPWITQFLGESALNLSVDVAVAQVRSS